MKIQKINLYVLLLALTSESALLAKELHTAPLAFTGAPECRLIQTGTPRKIIPADRYYIFSNKGNKVTAPSYKGKSTILDLTTGDTLTNQYDSEIYTEVFSPDENHVITVLKNGEAILRNLKTGALRYFNGLFFKDSLGYESVWFSPDGLKLALRYPDHAIKIHDLLTGTSQTISHAYRADTLHFSPDSNYVLTVTERTNVKLFHIPTGQEQVLFQLNRHVGSAAFSPDSKLALIASNDGYVRIVNLETRQIQILPFGGNPRAYFFPNGQRILVHNQFGGSDYTNITTLDLQSGEKEQIQFHGEFEAISPDLSKILFNKYLNNDVGYMRVLDLQNRRTRAFKYHNGSPAYGVRFSKDGEYLLLQFGNTETKVIHIETGAELTHSKPENFGSVRVTLSKDNQSLWTQENDWLVQTAITEVCNTPTHDICESKPVPDTRVISDLQRFLMPAKDTMHCWTDLPASAVK